MTMSLNKAIQAIRKSKSILISTHVNPDPDALCSELALYYYLKTKGKKVYIVNNEKVPERLRFLPGSDQVKAYKKKMIVNYDTAIVLDCGSIDRIGKVLGVLLPDTTLVNIDHHITNDNYGDINVVVPKASSTAEILYELLVKAKAKIDNNIALHIYAGIMTDTGSFRYENTTARTHEIISSLRKFPFSATKLYQQFYETISLNDMKHYTKLISQFSTLARGKVLSVDLKKSVASKFSQAFDLRDAIFKMLRSIKGVEVVVIFTQVGANSTRANFRSSGRVNVAKLAHTFNGGGHHNASGCLLKGGIKEAKKKVLNKLKGLV